MSIMNLCNCGGPSPEGHHEPHCLENGITQSLNRDRPQWSFNCPQCPYTSPFFHTNELSAWTAFQSHLQGCSGQWLVRADGYTEEQIKRWCICGRKNPLAFDGPEIDCPLHGGHVVEWQTFVKAADGALEFMGCNYVSDEYDDVERPLADALDRAEAELESIQRDEGPATEVVLQYRLIGPWQTARA